ncbi:MAG: hypothetical protein COZ06_33235 [Armatimonadetes bacterium CG_4_10_14_3_um_filter_66_18]|nr:MAG: hypothetical protein COS65_07760 [Armatimonadetes bacterium CG06_land_8_20_14_3_00_66_21]PIW16169.1 MAG: hypothetical protein COW34_06110 [Armatimonadetes bacterium CG17_big_fil_post_rev_8_21_14_2_50_66_6]PIX46322.1 MAG: hypothetical protein COZ57_12555 [Armatimonadetes bacterium CG_4_8_14_3_um_filter_66_20]PIY37275.1 MAG: hypothetical protein COZ06_33235 [Armatimonadetes bacterium CG_4_10_14_3_um_filter_66_18]PIZ33202.1 MAG: hypothetical protein COY42_30355 [Armatimonadetes bacterium C
MRHAAESRPCAPPNAQEQGQVQPLEVLLGNAEFGGAHNGAQLGECVGMEARSEQVLFSGGLKQPRHLPTPQVAEPRARSQLVREKAHRVVVLLVEHCRA